VADAEVGTAVVEAGQRDLGIDAEPRLGMQRGEPVQTRHQPGVGQRVQRGDADAIVVLAGDAQPEQHAFDVGHRAAGGIGELASLGGHPRACGRGD
jgi:hypothetical protein